MVRKIRPDAALAASLLLFSIFASLYRVGLWGYSEFKQFDDSFLHSGMAISRRDLSVAALPPPPLLSNESTEEEEETSPIPERRRKRKANKFP